MEARSKSTDDPQQVQIATDIVTCLYQLGLDLWVSSDVETEFEQVLDLLQARLGVTECGFFLQVPGSGTPVVSIRSGRVASPDLCREIMSRIEVGRMIDQFVTAGGVNIWLYAIPGNPAKPSYFILFDGQVVERNLENLGWFEQLCAELSNIMSTLGRVYRLRRQDLYEERETISRELHDSLAQSLTYIKIQISRLQATLDAGRDSAEVVGELRSSVNRAYRELRELMTTFRLTMHGKSFNLALEDSIKEFEQRSNIVFSLDNRLEDDCLGVDEEMQVLQVIREALSNAIRHSRASQVGIRLTRDAAQFVQIEISDDGVGIDPELRRSRHHGLLIMQERVHALQGRFVLQDRNSGGSRILISFKPGQTSTLVGSRKNDPLAIKVVSP